MGKKSTKNLNDNKSLSMTKRNELNNLVNSLLKLVFLETNNPLELWNQYLELHALIERIRNIENVTVIKKSNQRITSLEAFSKFMHDNGAKIDSVDVTEFPGYDLGLRAQRDFEKNELFITIPDKLVFSFDKAPMEVQRAAKTVSLISSMPNISLAFFLLVERLNPKSFWKPYFDVLPEKYSTVMYFKPNELNELKGSSALKPAINQIKNIARQYAVLYQIYQKLEDDYENPIGKILKDKFTFDLYCWSVSTVMTRQNLIPTIKNDSVTKQPALIPFWDFANHANGYLSTSYNIEKQQVESFVQKKYKKGEQIFIFYGSRNNTDLLVHNGFVCDNNEHECIITQLSLSSSDKLLDKRIKILDFLKMPKSVLVEILPAPIYISEKFLSFARVFNMTKDQLDQWIDSGRSEELFNMNCIIESDCELRTWNFIINRLTLLLKMSPTSMEEDKLILETSSSKINRIKQMLIRFRIIEKNLLIEALEFSKKQKKLLETRSA
ncbi:actin-histidine N-methyltransferase [Culicoides brevitarsis]|uniref:actin-histidine N-methyltransferase n=1 Tax=Culicoides brevitarsis TaxID=469753 RepID=UPI00307BCB5E